MADAVKEIVIKAKLDTGDSVSKINDISKNFKKIDLGDTNKAFDELNKRLEAGNLSTREMSKLMKDYTAIAIKSGQTSPIGQEALKKAGQLKDNIEDANAQIRVMAQDGKKMNSAITISSTALQGYQAFIGISQLAGGENKKLVETMSKMMIIQQSLTAVEQIAQQFRKGSLLTTHAMAAAYKILGTSAETASGGVKNFTKAFAASIIGAIVTALMLIVTNFKDIVNWVQNAWQSIKEFSSGIPVLSQIIDGLSYAFNAIGDAIQWVTELFGGLTREQKKSIELNQKIIDNTEKLVDAETKKYDRMLKLAQANGEDTFKLEKQKIIAIITLYKKQLDAYMQLKKTEGNLDEETVKKALESAEKMKDLFVDLKVLEINHEKKLNEQYAEYNDKLAKDRRDKELEEFKSLHQMMLLEYQTFVELGIKSQEDIDKYFEKYQEDLDNNIKQSMQKRGKEAEDFVGKYENNMQRFFDTNKKSKELIEQYGVSLIGNMGSVFTNLANLQEKGSKKQKDLALMSIVASEAESIAQAVLIASKATSGVAAVTGPAAVAVWFSTFASITAGIIASIASAKQILGEGGSSSGDVNTSSSGVTTGFGGEETSGTQQQTNEQTNTYPTLKVVMVETDVTKAQRQANYTNKISML